MILKKWESSSKYMGYDMTDWYIVYTKTRDSGILDQSNFDCIWEALKELRDQDPGYIDEKGLDACTVDIHNFGHWACGWIDCIMIQETNTAALKFADKIITQLNDYPVVNEDDYLEKGNDYAQEYWTDMSLKERIAMCVESRLSIFSARGKCFPWDCYESLTVDAM